MKKYFYSLMAVAAMLFAATSCSQDEFPEGTVGETMNVSFTVKANSATQTRALTDGTNVGAGDLATKMIYAVYENGKEAASALIQNTVSDDDADGTFNVTIPLVKGLKYDVLFLAYNEANNAFGITSSNATTTNLKALTLSSALKANQEAYDVFMAAEKAYAATGIGKTIYLTRPFAQLNVGTTLQDLKDAADLDVVVKQSEIVVKGMPTTLNVLTGEVSGEADKTFAAADLFKVKDEAKTDGFDNEKFTVTRNEAEETFYYLGMAYVLADAEKSLHDVEVSFHRTEGKFNTIEVSNLPLQRNYRTNIIGSLLTTKDAFDVIIVPGFAGEDYNTQEELESVLANGGVLTLFEDLALEGNSLTVAAGKEVTINLNGHKLLNSVANGAAIVNNGILTLKNGYVENTFESYYNSGTDYKSAHGIKNVGGTLVLENVSVGSDEMGGNPVRNENGGNVTINGGKFTSRDRAKGAMYGYVFYNVDGEMSINDATSVGRPNGMFSCNNGTITVNGGEYTINSGANTWYMAIATADGSPSGDTPAGTIYLNAGKFTWNKGTAVGNTPTMGNVVISTEAEINWTTEQTTIVTTQAGFEAALQAGGTILLGKPVATKGGTADYTWPNVTEKTFELVGTEEGIVIDMNNSANTGITSNIDVSFNNVTLKFNNVTYSGFQHSTNETYTNCVIEGQPFLYATAATFNGCTFNQSAAGSYNVWTYGATAVNFNNCIFNSAGKSVLIYTEKFSDSRSVTIENCKFIASSPANDGKAAIEIDSSKPNGGTGTYTVTINNTTATGFDKGSMSGSTLVNQKKGCDATIYVDGKEFFAEGVTKADDGSLEVSSAAGLNWISKQMAYQSFSGKTVKLTSDIDLQNQAWTPIGECTSGKYFQGVFDGCGHTITGLMVDRSTDESKHTTAGLFGWVDSAGATIKNVKIDGANVKGSHWVGIVAGYFTGRIENCTVTNSTVEGIHVNNDADGDKVGAIVGCLNEHSYINGHQVSNTTIKGNRDVGGIAGSVAASTYEMKNNTVTDVTITYITAKNYASAGAIVSGRTGYVADNSNVATNVKIYHQVADGVVKDVDGAYVAFDGAELKNLLQTIAKDEADVNIELQGDVTIAGEAYANKNTYPQTNLTINGNGHSLTFTDAYRTYFSCAEGGKIVLKDMNLIRSTTNNDTHWHNDNLWLNSDIEMEKVKITRGINISEGVTASLKNCTITETVNGSYVMFILPGAAVTIDGCVIDADDNTQRGIKITSNTNGAGHEKDITAGTKLSVSNTVFKTANKSAILVDSHTNTTITWGDGNDISKVQADTKNPVWNDAAATEYYDKVKVNDGAIVVYQEVD